jgi:ubiquilin
MDPSMLSSMLQNPELRQMFQTVSQNPAYMQTITDQMRRLAAGNPVLQQSLQPFLDDPSMLQAMYNPDTLDAMLQVQQGLSRLQSAGVAPPGMPAFGSLLSNPLFGGLAGATPGTPPDSRPAAERYADQLSQLADMGFTDTERNIRFLNLTGGDLSATIEHLVNSPFL